MQCSAAYCSKVQRGNRIKSDLLASGFWLLVIAQDEDQDQEQEQEKEKEKD